MEEVWKDVPNPQGYEASTLGRIRNKFTGRVLSPHCNVARGGHLHIKIGGRRGRNTYVHTLVLETFTGPRPTAEHVGRHLDGDPSNNRPENLEWGTVADNHADTIRHGRTTRGEVNPMAKLTADDVDAIRTARADGVKLKVLAARFGVAESCISRVANGRRWGHA